MLKPLFKWLVEALFSVSTNYNHYKDGSAFCTEGKKKLKLSQKIYGYDTIVAVIL
ncbi:MAG: hypothetical protein IJW27_01985 [Clostridia bacterium]|nr:hypothetical protein [Clostridia bacterium]